MYQRRSRISGRKQGKLLEHFVAGTTARAAALLVGVQANTVISFYQRVRQLIASKLPNYELSGEVEADECYFGGVRKGQRGRAAAGKVPVFGLLKRGGHVMTAIIPNAKSKTLMPIIRERVRPDSIVYTDSFTAYDTLDVSEFRHRRVNHSKTFVSKRGHHINGIENFWNQTKRHMRRFNGIPASHFHLYLKECEWRFNTPNPKQQQTQLIQWVTTHLK